MTSTEKLATEKSAHEVLLDKGVLIDVGWFTFNVKQPTLYGLLLISLNYMKLAIDEQKLDDKSYSGIYSQIPGNIKLVCRIIAIAILRRSWKIKVFGAILTRYLLHNLTPAQQLRYLRVTVLTNNYADFAHSIRLIQTLRMMKPKEDLIESLKED